MAFDDHLGTDQNISLFISECLFQNLFMAVLAFVVSISIRRALALGNCFTSSQPAVCLP